MANRYFTSDWHLNHQKIIQYCNRPFQDVDTMNKTIINNCNNVAKTKSDIVIHVGDLCLMGKDKGVRGTNTPVSEHINKLNCTFVNVLGNHDNHNKVKSCCRFMYTQLGPYFVSVGHYPSTDPEYEKSIPWCCPVHICGHVHSLWKYQYDVKKKVLNVNVGVDVWKQTVVSDSKLITFIKTTSEKLKLDIGGKK